MAAANPLGAQPDYQVIANEILKIPNTPAVAGGQEILNELRAMREQSARFETTVQQEFANIRQEFTNVRDDIGNVRRDLITMMNVSNHNNAARVQNTYIETRTSNLSPFLNPVTGAVIPKFPTTIRELEGMDRRRLGELLQQLGIQDEGGANLADLKRILRAQIGLRATRAPTPP